MFHEIEQSEMIEINKFDLAKKCWILIVFRKEACTDT